MSQSDEQIADKAHNRAHWDEMAPRWMAWWERYGPASQPVSDWLVAQAQVSPGARVLDLATGLGEPALSFARAVGPQGLVLGVDQSAQMIAFARERAQAEGLEQLRFAIQDVEALELAHEPPFDALVSRWGLMFCTDLAATLARMRSLLKADGRLVAAVWREARAVPLLSLAGQVLQQSLGIDMSRPGPGPFTLADPEGLRHALRAAGFAVETLETVDVSLVYASAPDYLKDRCQTSPLLESTLAELQPDQRQHFDAALAAALEPWRQGDHFNLVNKALCVSCRLF